MVDIQLQELPAFSGEDEPRQHYVQSLTYELYKSFFPKNTFISSGYRQMFNINNISYNPTGRHENFSYEVESYCCGFPFYQIQIKIAHFVLAANVIKVQDNNYWHRFNNKNHGSLKIGFQSFMGDQICIKRLMFKDQNDFQHVFRKCIKQWTILKICSAIQCAPYMKNYLGFDILIYDNYIEFYCERGEKITKYSLQFQEDLRKSLCLMHYFKIIHLDVKPQNTAYSFVYSKPVFIDFGFSEIINEECGYQTLTIFKGTPNYCCPEMFAIMNQDSNYVDLYYNDAYGLNLAFQYLRVTSKTIVDQLYDSDQPEPIIESQRYHCCAQLHYFLAFQYQYLIGNQEKARKFLSGYMRSCKNNPYRVFKFIKGILKQTFCDTLFYQDLKEFSKMAEYTEIKQSIKVLSQGLHLMSRKQTEQLIEQQKFVPLSYDGQIIPTQDFTHYQKLILELQSFQPETVHNFLAIAFNSIRFDIRNNDFSSKVLIAGKVRKLVASYMGKAELQQIPQAKTQQEGLRVIQDFFLQLFDFCLRNKKQNWTKDRVFDIFQQFILLDINIAYYIDDFIQYVNAKFQSATELALASFQSARLLKSTKIIPTKHVRNKSEAQRKLKGFIRLQDQKLFDKSRFINDRQIREVCKVLQLIQTFDKDKQNFLYSDVENCVTDVKNSKIRRYLGFSLTQIRLQLFSNTLDSEQILQLIQQLKRSQLSNLDFFSFLSLTHNMIRIGSGVGEIPQYCDFIKSVINCPTIFERIQIALLNLHSQFNLNSINLSLSYFLDKYSFQGGYAQRDYQVMQQQLLAIITHISRLPYSLDYVNKLGLLYPIYEQVNREIRTKSRKYYKDCLKVYIRIQIEYIYHFLDQSRMGIFSSNRDLCKAQLQRQLNGQRQDKSRMKFLQFQTTMYQFKLLYHRNELRYCIQLLPKLITFCLQEKMVFIVLQLYFYLHEVSMILKEEEAIFQAIMSLHHFCFQHRFSSFYLLQISFEVSLTTFAVFAKRCKDRLIKMLIILGKFVQLHPLKCYIGGLMRLCHHFLSMHPEHEDVFRPYIFDQELTKNPYLILYYVFMIQFQGENSEMQLLKKIARKTDGLIGYAKRVVLNIYFQSYFRYRTENNLKKVRFIFRFAKCYVMNRGLKKEKLRQLLKASFSESNPMLRRVFNRKKQRMIKTV